MRVPLLFVTLALVACSSSAPDARLPPVDAGEAPDAGCPEGEEAMTVHTEPVDVYGTCSTTCAGTNGPKCSVLGGWCACPVGATCDYLPDGGGGTATVCEPLEADGGS